MANARSQTYATHRYQPTAWRITWLASAVALLMAARAALRAPTLQSIALVVLALVAMMTVWLVRVFALRLQNRIIRLEMQVRLARLGREDALERLDMRQIVALRFASDAEMGALIDRTIGEKLTPDQIKRAVTDWQGDYLRT